MTIHTELRREVKNMLDNLTAWDKIDFKSKTYEVLEIEWEWFDLKDVNSDDTNFLNYDDLFDDTMEDKMSLFANEQIDICKNK